MTFNCVFSCNNAFSTKAGLTWHQNGCSSYRTLQALKQEQRRAQLTLPKVKLNPRSKLAGESLNVRKSRINMQTQVSIVVGHLSDRADLYWLQALCAYPI